MLTILISSGKLSFGFFLRLYFYLDMCVYICVHRWLGEQKRMSNPLVLELQVVLSAQNQIWVL